MYSRIVILSLLCAVGFLYGCNRKSRNQRVIRRDGEPDVVSIGSDAADMNAAIAESRRNTDAFLQILAAPKKNQTDFSAKRPYPTADGSSREHIWISHLTYDGKLLHGTVGDEPVNIPNLKFDEPVSFLPAELSDWMYLEDGKVVGGYTIRVLRKHMSASEGAEFDRHLQFKQ